ncbi:MAG: DUF3987 domain-containing protein [Planctomycetaceae bacterium]|nr:DUF3987 domain-containing protein [Planctomycetaceae bacterium]
MDGLSIPADDHPKAETANETGPSGSDLSTLTPPKLSPIAMHGIVGKWIRLLAPQTEADPAALLVQFLVGMGSVIGRHVHIVADGAIHYANLFAVIMGNTSRSRKGTSWAQVKKLLHPVDPRWNIVSGLSSGEGLIHAVRDPIGEDSGITDKRLLVVETEFSRTLMAMRRESNILSTVLRDAWDQGYLNNIVRKDPRCSTNAHISIIGHITEAELQKELQGVDRLNGFANRFLWIHCRRSQLLPHGGSGHKLDLSEIRRELQEVLEFAAHPREFLRDPEADKVWDVVYRRMNEMIPDHTEPILARGESIILRLSLLFAVLDRSELIQIDHLNAAIALWDYCEDSVRYVFGRTPQNRTAERILNALRNSPSGLTRTEISGLFGRHKNSNDQTEALNLLQEKGLARQDKVSTGGRSIERWFAATLTG